MTPEQFADIRIRLGMTQAELAELFALKSAVSVSHYETGFRPLNLLLAALMSYMDRLSESEALDFKSALRRHLRKVSSSQDRGARAK